MNRNLLMNITGSGQAVGISVGARTLQAAGLSRAGREFHLDANLSVEFPTDRAPHPAEIESAIHKMTEAMGGKVRTVTGIRAADSRVHFFNAPFDRPDKVREVLPYTAEPLFMGSVENLILDYLPLNETGGQGDPALVFGVKADLVSLALDEIRQAGLDPEVILPDCLGLIAAGRYFFNDDGEEGRRLLIDLGASQTSLVLFASNQPVMVRTLPYGGNAVTQELASSLGLEFYQAETIKKRTELNSGGGSPEQDALKEAWRPLIEEIERTIIAGFMDGSQAGELKLALAGGGARTPGLSPFLADHLRLEVSSLGLDEPSAAKVPGITPELVPALGLAMLGLNARIRPNLRQGGLAPRQVIFQSWRPLALAGGGFILAGLLAFSSLVFNYFYEQRQYNAVKTEIAAVFKETAPEVTQVVYPLAQMKQKIDQVRAEIGGGDRQRVLDLLLAVGQVASSRPDLRVLDLSLTPQGLELKGEGSGFENIDRVKDELSRLPYFSEVTVGAARVDPATRKLTFTLSLKRK